MLIIKYPIYLFSIVVFTSSHIKSGSFLNMMTQPSPKPVLLRAKRTARLPQITAEKPLTGPKRFRLVFAYTRQEEENIYLDSIQCIVSYVHTLRKFFQRGRQTLAFINNFLNVNLSNASILRRYSYRRS